MTLAQHQSASNEHYTPIEIVDAARSVMGGIDLDPATTELVNRRVRASAFYTKELDGFSKAWRGRVFLNPPGGKTGNKSNAALWWDKLVNEYVDGVVTEAIFIGFTLEILATSQDSLGWIGDFPFCVPRKRIAFDKESVEIDFYDGSNPPIVSLVPGDSPPHSNVIVYLPATTAGAVRFHRAFSKFGRVVMPDQDWAEAA